MTYAEKCFSERLLDANSQIAWLTAALAMIRDSQDVESLYFLRGIATGALRRDVELAESQRVTRYAQVLR